MSPERHQEQQQQRQQEQQQQQNVTPSGVRTKRRVGRDPSTSSPAVEERILREMSVRVAAASVNATLCNYILAVLNSCDADEAQRTRDKNYHVLNNKST